jgi:hypothetical protein
MTKRKNNEVICTFCVGSFERKEIWWVDMKMNREDVNSTLYSAPSCFECKNLDENSWRIFGEVKNKSSKNEKTIRV